MNEKNRKYAYIGVRMLELLFASALVFGLMWQGAESLMLSVPGFLILYGLIGTLTCELTARALNKSAKFRTEPKKQRAR